MGRRDGADHKWKDVKKIVYERDLSSCRLLRVVSLSEYSILRKNAGVQLQTIDPAHIKAVSERPDLCYDADNIVCLNRFSHDCLDTCKNPVTGSPISKEQRDAWWKKIAGDRQFEKGEA